MSIFAYQDHLVHERDGTSKTFTDALAFFMAECKERRVSFQPTLMFDGVHIDRILRIERPVFIYAFKGKEYFMTQNGSAERRGMLP